MRRWAGMLVLALGCGDAEPDALDEDTVAPLARSAGDQVALVVADRVGRDPLVGEPECALTVQVGEATASGAAGGEGACWTTDAPFDLRDGYAPLDGGTLDLRIGSSVDRITVDGSAVAGPLAYECARLESAASVGVVSVAGESPNDVLGAFEGDIPLMAIPTLSAPVENSPGYARWGTGDLALTWNGGLGDAVEVVVAPEAGGTAVRCSVADDGSFDVPGELLEGLRSERAILRVARVGLERRAVDGVQVRLASRSATERVMLPF